MEPTYTIKTTANLTDLNAHTIRAWERRYKALEPSRHENGRRLYSQEDVRRLLLLSRLVNQGHAISSIAGLSSSMLEVMACEQEAKPTASVDAPREAGKAALDHATTMVLSQCLKALHGHDLVSINSELEAARLLFTAKEFVLSIAMPLLAKVGELVSIDQISIAQEHALSAVLRSQLMQILFNARNSIAIRSFTRKDLPHGKTISIATQEGDLHEFGALLAAILVAVNGHVPNYYGANMPVQALADAANATNSDVVIVGVTYIPDEMRKMSDEEYGRELESRLLPRTRIWWGGHANLTSEFLADQTKHRLFRSLQELDTSLIAL